MKTVQRFFLSLLVVISMVFLWANLAGAAGGPTPTPAAQIEREVRGQLHGHGPAAVGGGCPPGPFGDNWVHFQNNAYVDSYDSRVAAWQSKGAQKEANAGSNCNGSSGGISLNNNAIIYGNASVVTPESEGDITQLNNSVIWDHDKLVPPKPLNYSCEPVTLEEISMPSWWTLPSDSKIHCDEGYGSKSGQYEIINHDFRAYNNAEITLDGGEYHFNTFEIRNNVKITIDAPGSSIVEIYVESGLVLENNSEMLPTIEFSGSATKLRFYYGGSTNKVDLSNNVKFYGVIYAPNALIEVQNNDKIWGNLIGKEVYIWNNAGIHYDKALGSMDFSKIIAGGPPEPPPERLDWREPIVN